MTALFRGDELKRPTVSGLRLQWVTSACAAHIPVGRLPAHVTITRSGHQLTPSDGPGTDSGGLFLQRDDQVRVSTPAGFTFSYAGNRFRVSHGRLDLQCRRVRLGAGTSSRRVRVLAVDLQSGRVQVWAGGLPRRALVVSRELLALPTTRGTNYVVDRNPNAGRTRAWTLDKPTVAARATDPALRIDSRVTYTAISDRKGLRLDVWPFSITPIQRAATRADHLVPFWDDGRQCSIGCRAFDAIPGWPLWPFHQQHAIRSAFNELRPANFHIGIDIEAENGQAVYPIQSGFVQVFGVGTADERVQVGQFEYWHIKHMVSDGQYAFADGTELGTVKYDFRHVHLSEIGPAGQYLNPLRPGRTLAPYADHEPPIIGRPRVLRNGRAVVGAFDPQSLVATASYETPVLAPAALAWRLYSARGRPVTGLEWALRGSQNYPPGLRRVVYAPGAANPGYGCFAYRHRCIPRWTYWLAGGLTETLPVDVLQRGRYRLSVYAWDWAGNTAALDDWIDLPLARGARAPAGPVVAASEYP